MDNYKIKTCGSLIEEARIEKKMTIQDLVNEINNQKKKNEKDIDIKTVIEWESSKDYPELEMCYKLAYILELNPTELLGLRNFERKKFKTKKTKRTIWNQEVPEEFFWAMKGIFGLAAIMVSFYIVVQVKKLESSYMNGDGKLEKTLVNSIEDKVNQNKVTNEYEYNNETKNNTNIDLNN